MNKILAALVLFVWGSSAIAAPSSIAMGKLNLADPIFSGTASGNFTFAGVVLAPTPSGNANAQQIATVGWVNTALANSGSGSGGSASYCATTGCTFSANGGNVTLTPWNYQGYNALSFGTGWLTFSNGSGTNVGLGYIDSGNSSEPSLLIKNGSLHVGKHLLVDTQDAPSSSSESCVTGMLKISSAYMYYCISDGKWGRTPWQTGW